MKSPIFLFSLPRAGSTLLQRVLMGHRDIASVAEPWIMLPFIYASKDKGILAEYSHSVSHVAISDFIENLPEKDSDYGMALREFAASLYKKICSNDELYFLDKTPRYYLIIPELAKIFPDAKFIFLFRNPVHVMGSMIETWGTGRLNRMYNYDRDLNFGVRALSEGYELLKDISFALKYENFVADPDKYTREICRYLDVDYDGRMISDFSVKDTRGSMGDSTGTKEYISISTKSASKYKDIFNTHFRKRIIRGYIKTIDDNTLMSQGYNKESILLDIERIPTVRKRYFQDRVDYAFSAFIRRSKANIILGGRKSHWAKDIYLS